MRYRLTIEYQGTRYHGWQGQQNARTVQGELLRAGRELFGGEVDIQGSGRTDAGVHALGQVAHLGAARSLPAGRVVAGLNELLPPDINVLGARAAAPAFHARHDAEARSYLYQVSRRRTAFGKPFVWWVRDPLDASAMRRAAAGLAGMRDCAGFTDKRVEKDTSTLVLMQEAVVAEAGDLLLVRLRASHFLWKMVRRLVGCLVGVGRGELSAADFAALFGAASPYPARVTAPPSGLFLEEVIYPGESFTRPLVPAFPVDSPVLPRERSDRVKPGLGRKKGPDARRASPEE
ncbi:MAG TPA: tRNA pseudouridine(38-40) synthase TruA [Candidatus Methanoperedens sp.]|nr:tRNA pseudouridine(38-40) synthase TruA [Candidatus Methanoperedens sp.]